VIDGRDVVAFQVQSLTHTFEHFTTRLTFAESTHECHPSGRRITASKGRPPFIDQGRAHEPMMARALIHDLAYCWCRCRNQTGTHPGWRWRWI
jgi:hypothetical protein